MSENAYYEMKVIGSPEDVEAFILTLTDYDLQKHFGGVESAVVIKDDAGDVRSVRIDGWCDTSLWCCMSGEEEDRWGNSTTTLAEQSEIRNLKIEAFSVSTDGDFAEHYLFDCGKKLADECVEGLWWDEDGDDDDFDTEDEESWMKKVEREEERMKELYERLTANGVPLSLWHYYRRTPPKNTGYYKNGELPWAI